MSNIVSYWSPLDIVLPTITNDTAYGMWFVTDSGSIDGLDMSFDAGDWLIYLKKDGVGSWFKTSGGVSVFNNSSSANNPDPGIYTRVRLDNAGNVIGADYLEASDIPAHKHEVSDLNANDFKASVQRIVGDMFTGNRAYSSIKMKYNEETKTVSAEVNYDDLTLSQNEFGELVVIGGGTTGGAIGGSTADLSCGNHSHSADQIESLEEFVINVINQNRSLNVKDIPIDGQTIVLNSSGQLTAVAAGIQAHKHKMDDISDLNKDIANVWASNQKLQGIFEGHWKLTGQSIGYSIQVMNVAFDDIYKRLQDIEETLKSVEAPVPLSIEFSKVVVEYTKPLEVKYIKDFSTVTAGISATVITDDFFYPANRGTLEVVVDNKVVDTINFTDKTKLAKINNFCMLAMADSYLGNPMYMGSYESMRISYECTGLSEGYHNIYFVHKFDNETHTSRKAEFAIYGEVSPSIKVTDISFPKNNTWVSGIRRYITENEAMIKFKPFVASGYASSFLAKVPLAYTVDGEVHTPNPVEMRDGNLYFEEQTILLDTEHISKKDIVCTAYSVSGAKASTVFATEQVSLDTSESEKYRVDLANSYADQSPIVIGAAPLAEYKSDTPVNHYELIIHNDIGSTEKTDYSSSGGADYSGYPIGDYYWVNFRFPASYIGNLHLTLLKGDKSLFSLNRNGTLQDIKIFVAQADTDTPNVWVNGNEPYIGYGAAKGLNYSGLDLFKSTQSTRYITFGQRPDIKSGYVYVRIGVKESLDIKSLINSIKESINEWA